MPTTLQDRLAKLKDNGLVHAGGALAIDMVSTLVFAGIFALTHSPKISLAVGVATSIGQIGFQISRGRQVHIMEWLSFAMVLLFGGASLMFHDARFIMMKPALAYIFVGCAMLSRGWMMRYLPLRAAGWGEDLMIGFGYVWAALMFATAGLNFWLAQSGDVKAWAWFIGVFPLGSKLGLFAIQYIVIKTVVVNRMRRAGHFPAEVKTAQS